MVSVCRRLPRYKTDRSGFARVREKLQKLLSILTCIRFIRSEVRVGRCGKLWAGPQNTRYSICWKSLLGSRDFVVATLRPHFERMELANLTWPDVDALDRNTPVVIPVAALEQHGRHMPVFTDSMLLGEIVRRAHQGLEQSILITPLMWLGNSHHHMDFPGTMSAEPRVWIDLLSGLVENFITHGFRRIVVINGHGGNDVPSRQAIFELRQKYRDRAELLMLFATYWSLADPVAADSEFHQNEMGHAGEWETAMILRLAPQLVKDHEGVVEVPFGNPFLPAQRAWVMPDRSESGHIGHPAKATSEKGELLFSLFADGLTKFLQRVIAWDGKSWDG